MLLRRRELIRACRFRVASAFIAVALILANALFTHRVANADSANGGIKGTVKDETGEPIAGARVENCNRQWNATRKTLTDKDGRYVLDELDESYSGFRVLVRAAGRSPVEQEVQPGPAGKPARVDFTLSPGHVLHGRVVDENGKPISGVMVSPAVAPWMQESAAQSDKDGRFQIGSLPADARFEIFKSGYTKLRNILLRLDSSGIVTVVLQPMGVIRGRVLDAQSGKPLDRFSVWMDLARTGDEPNPPGGYNGILVYPGRKFTSSDGTFTIPDLTNRMAVEVSVAAAGHTKCVLPVVVAAPLNEAKPVTFSLASIEPGKLARFSGRVLDHTGRPVSGANLRLIISSLPAKGPDDVNFDWSLITSGEIAGRWYGDQFLEAVSDVQGQFEFKVVLPRKHWQLAYWGAGVPRDRLLGSNQTVPGPAPSLTIKLPDSARMVVTIDRVKYPRAWQLAAQLSGSATMTSQIDLDRGQTNVEIKDLVPGDYDLHLLARPVFQNGSASIESIAIQQIHLKPGETKQIRF